MARTNGAKLETHPETSPAEATLDSPDLEDPVVVENSPTTVADGQAGQDVDACLNALKSLLTAVEKLQKVRQEVGDIKPLLVRMLDGEVMTGDDLEQLKVGVNGLSRLVKAYSDHQTALTNAQPARSLLDDVLKVRQPVS